MAAWVTDVMVAFEDRRPYGSGLGLGERCALQSSLSN
jgi:hypothetical protein